MKYMLGEYKQYPCPVFSSKRFCLMMLFLACCSGCQRPSNEYQQYLQDQQTNREAIKALDLQQSSTIPYEQRIKNAQYNQELRSLRQQRVNIYR